MWARSSTRLWRASMPQSQATTNLPLPSGRETSFHPVPRQSWQFSSGNVSVVSVVVFRTTEYEGGGETASGAVDDLWMRLICREVIRTGEASRCIEIALTPGGAGLAPTKQA